MADESRRAAEGLMICQGYRSKVQASFASLLLHHQAGGASSNNECCHGNCVAFCGFSFLLLLLTRVSNESVKLTLTSLLWTCQTLSV